jgi:hypothetical protein
VEELSDAAGAESSVDEETVVEDPKVNGRLNIANCYRRIKILLCFNTYELIFIVYVYKEVRYRYS